MSIIGPYGVDTIMGLCTTAITPTDGGGPSSVGTAKLAGAGSRSTDADSFEPVVAAAMVPVVVSCAAVEGFVNVRGRPPRGGEV